MKGNIEERAQRLALYIIENQTTVRAAAGRFGISKSTVHTDVTKQNGPRFKSEAGTVFLSVSGGSWLVYSGGCQPFPLSTLCRILTTS